MKLKPLKKSELWVFMGEERENSNFREIAIKGKKTKNCLYATILKNQNPYNPAQDSRAAQTARPPIASSNGVGFLCKPNSSPWIFDFGATDTMTFDSTDLLSNGHTNRTHIQTANGECVNVAQAGTIDISSSIQIKNCLLIPNLSHKLLSISQLTKELNCILIMSSTDCVV